MNELKALCYELLARYEAERAWIAECFCKDEDEKTRQISADHNEFLDYKERIEKAAGEETDSFIGLTD